MLRTVKWLALLAVMSLMPVSASAQMLCRCAQQSLEARICENDLTARIFVWSGYTDATTGNRVYTATVQETFEGSTGNVIAVEVPWGCGLDLKVFTSYAVSINGGENGRYTTFACSSWVKPWRKLTRAELSRLQNPECPATCEDVQCGEGETCELQDVVCVREPCYPVPVCAAGEDDVCYRFSESNPNAFVDRPCAEGLKCASTSTGIGFDSDRFCKPQDYCIGDSTAASDCAHLPHIAVPGQWGCDQNRCVFRAGLQH